MCFCSSPLSKYTLDDSIRNYYYYTNCAIKLHNAVANRDLFLIKQLIENGEDVNEICAMHGGTALIVLVKYSFYNDLKFIELFEYLITKTKVKVRFEDHRGRNALYFILAKHSYESQRVELVPKLLHLTFDQIEDGVYDFKDAFKLALLPTCSGKGDLNIFEEYYKKGNDFYEWIKKLLALDDKCHIICAFLHSEIDDIRNIEFKYMAYLDALRKVFKGLEIFYKSSKKRRIFYQILFRLVKIHVIESETLELGNHFPWATELDRFESPPEYSRCLKNFLPQVPINQKLFQRLNGLYYINDVFELETLFYDLYTEFNCYKDMRVLIPGTEKHLLDFLFPFITPIGFEKIFQNRLDEGDRYDNIKRYSHIDCFEEYCERFFPFKLYKRGGEVRCSYQVQPFPLKRIVRDAIRDSVYQHDQHPNHFIKNLKSFKMLPNTLKWYLRFVYPTKI